MLLSDLIEKSVYSGEKLRGVCLGVGISLKNYAVKYLLCANATTHNPLRARVDFSVPVSAVESVSDGAIRLSRLRSVCPKNCVCAFANRPIYRYDGAYLGYLTDIDLSDFTATRLFADTGKSYPFSAVYAFADAVILKKPQAYPLGIRAGDSWISKATLKKAINNKALIRFTLSLPPFQSEYLADNFKR